MLSKVFKNSLLLFVMSMLAPHLLYLFLHRSIVSLWRHICSTRGSLTLQMRMSVLLYIDLRQSCMLSHVPDNRKSAPTSGRTTSI